MSLSHQFSCINSYLECWASAPAIIYALQILWTTSFSYAINVVHGRKLILWIIIYIRTHTFCWFYTLCSGDWTAIMCKVNPVRWHRSVPQSDKKQQDMHWTWVSLSYKLISPRHQATVYFNLWTFNIFPDILELWKIRFVDRHRMFSLYFQIPFSSSQTASSVLNDNKVCEIKNTE